MERTEAEREMLAYLRRLVAGGFDGIDSYENGICWFCGEDNNGRRTKHKDDCLYVAARHLITKHSRAHV